MKIYLAGPMRGLLEANKPAFADGAKQLRDQDHEVFNPHEWNDTHQNASLTVGLLADMEYICLHAEAIAMLPGWEISTGAQAEWALAKALRLKFIYL
jgi:hypothetical protein